jgi:small subunit ribosomal protein S4
MYRRGRASDYSLQLREKQKVRRIYGVLERQFRRYYKQAVKHTGLTGTMLLTMLERRLDNVIYRMGFADSRAQARQLVSHGHFNVNGRRTNIPSYLVRSGDLIEVREGSRKRTYFKNLRDGGSEVMPPGWVTRDFVNLTGEVVKMPERTDIELNINEQLVVEYYNR